MQTMQIDKQDIARQVRRTGSSMLEAFAAFDEHQVNTPPADGGWTAGQVVEHLLLSAGLLDVITGRTATAGREPDEKLDAIRDLFLDYTVRLQSPEGIRPTAGPYEKREMLEKLKLVWVRQGEAVRLLDLSKVCLDFEFPVFGHLTRLEWIMFYVYHSQRHLRQLQRLFAAIQARPPHPLALPRR
jgi:DinB family protein